VIDVATQAHTGCVTSVEWCNLRHGVASLLITSGIDCFVHLWTSTGAHVGTFGQVVLVSICVLLIYVRTALHSCYCLTVYNVLHEATLLPLLAQVLSNSVRSMQSGSRCVRIAASL
jgi:hypothetical protein